MERLIAQIVASSDARLSNNEFILRWCGEKYAWRAGIGNPCQHVGLGEVDPEVEAEGDSAFEALRNLADKLSNAVRAA